MGPSSRTRAVRHALAHVVGPALSGRAAAARSDSSRGNPAAGGPTLAFVKRLLLSSDDEDLEQQMKHESASIVQMSRSHDGLAGVKAFKDKVEPSFTGS